MIKRFIYILIMTMPLFSYGQDENLQLTYNCLTSHPNFTKVNVIDNRASNQTLGFVQVGAFNKIALVAFQGTLIDSLAKYFLDNDTIGKSQSELTLLLYEIYLSEKTESRSETGRLKLSLRLFAKDNQENFYETYSIDSAYTFNALDVTKKLLHSVSEHMCEISAHTTDKNIQDSGNKPHYTLAELHSLDSLEKLNIPIYNTAKFNAGIFTDYEHFKTNTPDSSVITIDTSDSKNIKVFIWNNEKKKKTRVDCQYVYAVCDGKTLLKATAIGFYKMEKINNDFYYLGATSFFNSSNVDLWGSSFGIIGAAIASGAERNHTLFRFRINYRAGNSMPVTKAGK